jgi:hypothetical protein
MYGIAPEWMRLDAYNSHHDFICSLTDDSTTLGFYSLQDYDQIEVIYSLRRAFSLSFSHSHTLTLSYIHSLMRIPLLTISPLLLP